MQAMVRREWEKSAKNQGKNQKCRRADIFERVYPPVFAYVGEGKDLREGVSYAGETKELEEATLRLQSTQAAMRLA
jgi:hypothetical protein